MANRNGSTEATQRTTSIIDADPIYKPFSWLPSELEGNSDAQSAARLMDIAAGTRVITQIVRSHMLELQHVADGASGAAPLMSHGDIDALVGLAAVALSDLYHAAAAQVEALEQQVRKRGRA